MGDTEISSSSEATDTIGDEETGQPSVETAERPVIQLITRWIDGVKVLKWVALQKLMDAKNAFCPTGANHAEVTPGNHHATATAGEAGDTTISVAPTHPLV